jgi:hypothetical protein
MCRSNNTLICESHQQMSQRLSTLEERQHKLRSTMGFETPEPITYPPLAVEGPCAWYRSGEGDDADDDEIEEESE